MATEFYDLRQIDRELFEIAKRWEAAALSCKIVGFLMGLLVILTGLFSKVVPFIAIGLALFSEFCDWRKASYNGIAGTLLSKLDWSDAFGQKLSGKEITRLLLEVPARFRQQFSEEIQEQYFAAQTAPGLRRAIENVLESSWWSHNLAKKLGFRYQVTTWVLVVISIAILILSIQTVKDFDQLASIGRAMTSLIMCVFSFGLLKSSRAYAGFSRKAGQIEERAEELLEIPEPTKEDAITLMYDYQIIRMNAPLIPTWLYKRWEPELNRLWKQFRRRPPAEELQASD